MPSHGPTEPPEDSGWEDEYDKIMEAAKAKALLKDLYRIPDLLHTVIANMEPSDFEDIETDDDDLQAFVQMVYDRGIAHGYGNAKMEEGLVAMDAELREQERWMNPDQPPGAGGMNMAGVQKDPSIKYVPGARRDTNLNPIPTEDIMGRPVGVVTSFKPTVRPVAKVYETVGAKDAVFLPGRVAGSAGRIVNPSEIPAGDEDAALSELAMLEASIDDVLDF